MVQTELHKIEKGLISIAAAIAAGCKPCMAKTVHLARTAGASEEEITHAMTIALDVKRRAYDDFHQEARKYMEIPADDLSLEGFKGKTTTDWLIATGAAFAANFTLGLEHYSAEAEQLGATVADLNMALEIARRVKEQAGKETEKIATMVVPLDRQKNVMFSECGCLPHQEQKTANCCA